MLQCGRTSKEARHGRPHVSCDSVSMNCPEQGDPQRQGAGWWTQEEDVASDCLRGSRVSFGDDLNLGAVVAQHCAHVNVVNFVLCKFHFFFFKVLSQLC